VTRHEPRGKRSVRQWPSLWSSGQSSWLQIQRFDFDSRSYQIFCEVVGLERSPLSLVSTIEELLERKSSGSGPESREYGRRDPSRWPSGILYPQKLALTSPTSGGRSAGIVHSPTQSTEFSFLASNNSIAACARCHSNVLTEPLLTTIGGYTHRQTDGRDLLSTPLRWTQVPWYTQISMRGDTQTQGDRKACFYFFFQEKINTLTYCNGLHR
jgi:hypothetical protein